MLAFLLIAATVNSIAGGKDGSAPWYVVGVRDNKMCGGTLISQNLVVTSAQCKDAFLKGKVYSSFSGGLSTATQISDVLDFVAHEDFGPNCGFSEKCQFHQHVNDIALVKISPVNCDGSAQKQFALLPTIDNVRRAEHFYIDADGKPKAQLSSLGFTSDGSRKLAKKIQQMSVKRRDCETVSPDELITPAHNGSNKFINVVFSNSITKVVTQMDCLEADGTNAVPCGVDTGAGYVIKGSGGNFLMSVQSLSSGACTQQSRVFLGTDLLAKEKWLVKKIKESRGVPVGQCHPISMVTDAVIIAICVLCAGLLCCLVALYILYGQVAAPAPKQKKAVPGAWAFAPEAPVPMHLKPKRFTQMKTNMSNFASTIFGKKKKQSMYEQPVPSMAMQPVPSMQPVAEEEEAAQSLKSMSFKRESSPPVGRNISHRNKEFCHNSVSGLPMSVPATAFAPDQPRSHLQHDLGASIVVDLSRKLPLPDRSTSLPLHSLSKRATNPDSIRRTPVLETVPESLRPSSIRPAPVLDTLPEAPRSSSVRHAPALDTVPEPPRPSSIRPAPALDTFPEPPRPSSVRHAPALDTVPESPRASSVRHAPALDTFPQSPRAEKRRSVNSPSTMVKTHTMKTKGKGKGKGKTRLQIDPAALDSPSNKVPGPTKANMTSGATKSKKEFKSKGKGTRRAVE